MPPTAAEIAAFMRMPTLQSIEAAEAHHAKLVRAEIHRVCEIRSLARFTGLPPAPLLAFYVQRIHPALPVAAIDCDHQ